MHYNSYARIPLEAVDSVEITVVVDNYVDMLLSKSEKTNQRVTRLYRRRTRTGFSDTFLAEHGLCLLLEINKDDKKHKIIWDAGVTKVAAPHNIKAMGLDVSGVENILISHGHGDHYGSLKELIKLVSNRRLSVVVHPDVFLERYMQVEDGSMVTLFHLLEQSLLDVGANVFKTKTPHLMASNTVATTGEIERFSGFSEFHLIYTKQNGNFEKDRVLDDQALLLNISGKGLVVVSGCAHAGIINTIKHCQKITGIDKVYAVIGGFHLTGGHEIYIEETISELKQINPEIIVPMHCTGWKAIDRFSHEMPGAFILSSAGTILKLGT